MLKNKKTKIIPNYLKLYKYDDTVLDFIIFEGQKIMLVDL